MAFLVIVGLIGLAGIGASVWAIGTGGRVRVRTRDADYYRSEFTRTYFVAGEQVASDDALASAVASAVTATSASAISPTAASSASATTTEEPHE